MLKIAQILNPREERKAETIEIMVWWHKPLAPPHPLLEIWQRQQAGFPCHETWIIGCSGRLGFCLCWWSPYFCFEDVIIWLWKSKLPVLCRFILFLASLLYLQTKGFFSGKYAFWKHVIPMILGFDPFSFPFFHTVSRTSPNGPSSSHQSCTTNSLPLFSVAGVAMAAAALGIMILSWQSNRVHTSGKVWLVCWWGGRWLRGDSTQVKVSWEISLDFPVL